MGLKEPFQIEKDLDKYIAILRRMCELDEQLEKIYKEYKELNEKVGEL